MSLQTSDPPQESAQDAELGSEVPLPRRKGNERGVWVIAGRILGAGLAVLTHSLLTRLLSQAEYGKYTLILSTINFLIGLCVFGLDRALVRFIAEGFALGDRQRVRKALWLGLCTQAGSVTVCLLVVPPLLLLIGHYFPTFPFDPTTIAVILATVIFSTILQYVAEVFRGMHDQRNAAIFDAQLSKPLANGLYLAAVAVVGYFFLLNATGSIALQVVVLGGLAVVGVLHLRRSLQRIEALRPVRGRELPPLNVALFLTTCVPLVLSQMVGICNVQGDVWILGATLTEEDVGLFGAARRFVSSVSMPLMALNLMVLPSIPQLHVQGRTRDLEKLLQRNATMASIPCLFAVGVLLLFPGPLLAFMYGPQYEAGATCLMVMAVGQALYMLTGSSGQVLMLLGRERIVLIVEVIAAIALFGVGPFVAQGYGLTGFVVLTAGLLTLKKIAFWYLAWLLTDVWTHASLVHMFSAARSRHLRD